jgi:ABC-type glycerol-3-phosphate transport system permease component
MVHSFFSLVTRHWLSLVGTIIAIAALLLMVMLVAIEFSGFKGGPYLGILTYMILPMVLVAGLLMIPVGVILRRRADARASAAHEAPGRLPVIDLNNERTRGVVLASVVIGLVAAVVWLPARTAACTRWRAWRSAARCATP